MWKKGAAIGNGQMRERTFSQMDFSHVRFHFPCSHSEHNFWCFNYKNVESKTLINLISLINLFQMLNPSTVIKNTQEFMTKFKFCKIFFPPFQADHLHTV